jgi:putative colanic acid biosynthesis acetyltransferase WcaF
MQYLDQYKTPSDWDIGVAWPTLTLWFCFGAPLLSARWLPGSAWRIWLLRSFGSSIGHRCRIKPGLRVKYPWRLKVGDACWLAEDAWIDNPAVVSIGSRVCISQGAYLCTGNHNYRSPGFDLLLGPISVGCDVWIAARAVLSPGTCIGSGAVISIGAVVKGKIPSNSIVAGNPARILGWRSIACAIRSDCPSP